MANFRRTSTTINYLGRREQRRLLMLVLALGLVVFAMQEAAKPERWHWLWQGQPPSTPLPANEAPIDTRLSVDRPELDDDEILVTQPDTSADTTDAKYPPGVDAELLATVRDDTIFRGSEHEAWFHLFELLSSRDESQLAAESLGPLTFAQLFRQPDAYRGRLVTVSGRLRRAVWQTAPTNERGIEGYYQTWLQPDDNPADPMVIYCLKLPPGIPTGESISAEVTATGFFFKRWAYEAPGALRVAPVLLARTVQLRAALLTGASPTSPSSLPWIVGGGLLLAVVVVYYVARIERAKPRAAVGPTAVVLPPNGEEADSPGDAPITVRPWNEETRT